VRLNRRDIVGHTIYQGELKSPGRGAINLLTREFPKVALKRVWRF
jgi:hypothetical protein